MTNLNIADINLKGTYALGPGKRIALWVQGCPFRCFNCSSPEFLPFEDSTWVSPSVLGGKLGTLNGFDGITISGGDPMAQAEAISLLLTTLKQIRPEWSVILFTGYRIEQLISKCQKEVLKHVDVLIDGLYLDDKNDNIGLRGSSNQRIHHLSSMLKDFEHELMYGNRIMEFSPLNQQTINYVGIKPRNFNIN